MNLSFWISQEEVASILNQPVRNFNHKCENERVRERTREKKGKGGLLLLGERGGF